jgi:hypothetical protein
MKKNFTIYILHVIFVNPFHATYVDILPLTYWVRLGHVTNTHVQDYKHKYTSSDISSFSQKSQHTKGLYPFHYLY